MSRANWLVPQRLSSFITTLERCEAGWPISFRAILRLAVATPASSARVVLFGPYEADLHTRELRKHGMRLKLQEQPFQVLAMLVARPGELVTREEIRSRLWPRDTFIDFDHGLNAAPPRFRAFLNKRADPPILEKTLPRRGYSFTAQGEK